MFDTSGVFQWARTWGGNSDDVGRQVVADGSGDIYLAGEFSSTVDFDPGGGTDEHTSNGMTDTFLSKLDSSGNFQWARTWGASDYDRAFGMAADGSGNIYVTGDYCFTVDFDPGGGTDEHTSNGNDDVFLSKFDSNGVFQWALTWGADNYDGGNGVATDGFGSIYVTGWFHGTVDFDPGGGTDEHTSNGWADVSLSKFPADGNW